MTEVQFQKTVLEKLTGLGKRLVKIEEGQSRFEERQIKFEKAQESILTNIADLREEISNADSVNRAEMNQAFRHISNLTRRVDRLEQARR